MVLEAPARTESRPAPVNSYRPYGASEEIFYCHDPEVVLSGPAGTGKAQPLDSKVWTPDGPVRMGDLAVGDRVLAPDGSVSMVMAIYPQGERDVYKVSFTGGDFTECTEDHLWELGYCGGSHKGNNVRRNMRSVQPLSSIERTYRISCGPRGSRPKYWIPMTEPVAFDPIPVMVPPYTLGVLLGDGYIRKKGGVLITVGPDREIAEHVQAEIGADYRVKWLSDIDFTINAIGVKPHRRGIVAKRGYISGSKGGRWMARARVPGGTARYLGHFDSRKEAQKAIDSNTEETHHLEEIVGGGLWWALGVYQLEGKRAWEKFIPDAYKYNSIAVRSAVVQGLMDTDGTVDKVTGGASLTTTSRRMAEDLKEVVESLGGVVTITEKVTTHRLAYNCWVSYNNTPDLFRLSRKRLKAKVRTKYPVKRMLLSIEPAGRKLCQCITVSAPSGLYLTDHFIVTHNSRSVLECLHLCAEKYPGMRALIVRKTRESLNETALFTYEEKVLPPRHPALGGSRRNFRQSYRYPNGSQVVIGGLDKPSKIMSSEYDMIYVQEAIELFEEDWEALTTRLRNGVLKHRQQIIGDTNPDAEHHWLYQRMKSGKTTFLESRHEDNPLLFDQELKEWTQAGKIYLARLDELTGVRKSRLRHGMWVAAEGLVYDEFDPKIHVINDHTIPITWKRYRTIDFGFTNPFVCGWYAEDPDGRLYHYREIYRTQQTVAAHAKRIKLAPPYDQKVVATVSDHDAEDRATLHENGIFTVPAFKDISPGIQACKERLKVAGDGKPRMFFMRDARGGAVDPYLAERKKPTSTLEEIVAYVWPKNKDGRPVKENPVKENDHGMDAWRYLVCHVDNVGHAGGWAATKSGLDKMLELFAGGGAIDSK